MPTISTPTDTGYPFTATGVTLAITATGTVTSAGTAVYSGYANDTVVNNGMIAGRDGVYGTSSGFEVVNLAGGSITGFSTGVSTSGANATIINFGTIDVPLLTTLSGTVAVGIYDFQHATLGVANAGTVHGYVGNLVNSGASETITNTGEIDGVESSISSRTGAGGTNYGDGGALVIHNDGLLRGDILFGNAGGSFDGTGGMVEGNISGGTGNELFDLSHQTVTGTIAGGGGSDTIAFASASGGFNVDLGDGTAYGASEAFVFSGIENATGSAYADTINGDDGSNIVNGGAGNDVINGNGGADIINAGPGVDTVSGGAGNDVINGNGGNDALSGNGGADQITGGAGADTLTGGAGNDTFIYNLVTDSTTAAPDRITDFTHGSDKIDLTALHLPSPGDVTITSSGGVSNVNIDTNNDGTFDMLIQVSGSIALTDIVTAAVPAARSVHAATQPAAHHDFAGSAHAASIDHGLYG